MTIAISDPRFPSRRILCGLRRALAGIAFLCAGVAPTSAMEADLPLPDIDMSRLVAIGGSLTEIVYALGEESRLVARDTTSTYPEAAKALPDVGYMRALSAEGVLSVDPSAILALEGSGPPETIDVLEKASVPFVLVPEGYDRAGILEKIRTVGAALDVEEEADALARRVATDLDAAEALTDNVSEPRRVLFILSLQGGRVMASGTETAADGMIRLAGGVNAIDGYEGYKQLTDEAVIEARPDVIVMMSGRGGLDTPAEEVLSHPALASTPAAANEALVRMDGLYLLGFGPRTGRAVMDLAKELYGERISN